MNTAGGEPYLNYRIRKSIARRLQRHRQVFRPGVYAGRRWRRISMHQSYKPARFMRPEARF